MRGQLSQPRVLEAVYRLIAVGTSTYRVQLIPKRERVFRLFDNDLSSLEESLLTPSNRWMSHTAEITCAEFPRAFLLQL